MGNLYLGRGQIAECMRSGAKCLASQLVRDGRNPGLLVLPEWADPAHPQERPYIPDDVEGSNEWPMAPDNLPPTGLTLAGNYFSGGHLMALRWNIATLWGPRAKTYTLRRSTDGGAYVAISTNLVDYTNATGHDHTVGIVKDYGKVYYVNTDYTDNTPLDNHIYTYQVAAVDDVGDDVAASNVVTLNTFTNTVTGNQGTVPPVAATILLLHMDGTNGSQAFIDSSSQGLTSNTDPSGPLHLNPIFNAQMSTAQKQFGTASYTGTAGGGSLRVINNNIISPLPSFYAPLDGQDFTYEASFYAAGFAASNTPLLSMSNYANLAQTFIDINVNQVNGFITVLIKNSAQVVLINTTDNLNICNGAWHQVCLQRTGLTYALYVDGVRRMNTTTTALGTLVLGDLTIGATAGNGGNYGRDTWIDEVRYTQGAALYSGASYTPATGPFTG